MFLTRFLYREVTSPQPAWAPKTHFEGKTFYFVRKSTWGITESPGAFCTEQAQNITRRSELTPPTPGRVYFFGHLCPTQPYWTQKKWAPESLTDRSGFDRFLHRERCHQSLAGGPKKRFFACSFECRSKLPWSIPRCPGAFCID